jgi:hypothetical protein
MATTANDNKNTSSTTTTEPATTTSITTVATCTWQTTTVPYKPARSSDNTTPTMGSLKQSQLQQQVPSITK